MSTYICENCQVELQSSTFYKHSRHCYDIHLAICNTCSQKKLYAKSELKSHVTHFVEEVRSCEQQKELMSKLFNPMKKRKILEDESKLQIEAQNIIAELENELRNYKDKVKHYQQEIERLNDEAKVRNDELTKAQLQVGEQSQHIQLLNQVYNSVMFSKLTQTKKVQQNPAVSLSNT